MSKIDEQIPFFKFIFGPFIKVITTKNVDLLDVIENTTKIEKPVVVEPQKSFEPVIVKNLEDLSEPEKQTSLADKCWFQKKFY